MPYRICKTIEIENGHMLSKHPDKCQFPHGHSRKVEMVLEAAELDQNEMVCDFKAVKQVIGAYLDSLDHAMCMNTEDPMYATFREAYGDRVIAFEALDPTTEVIAKVIFDKLSKELRAYEGDYAVRPEVKVISVRVWETSSSWAEYFDA